MTIPQTSDSFGNMMRLQGLKNVTGRRKVLPGAQFLQQMEGFDNDVSGTSQNPFMQNLPQIETGAEISPQSYDVRANEVVAPAKQEEEQESIWTKLGRALGMQQREETEVTPQTPPIETQQADLQQGLPPVSASQEEAADQGFFSSLMKEANKPYEGFYLGRLRSLRDAAKEEIKKDFSSGVNPIVYEMNPDIQKPEALINQQKIEQEEVKARAEKALENPESTIVYGATDLVANQPDLKEKFRQITGIDLTEEKNRQTAAYEKVLDDMENGNNQEMQGYTEQEKRIAQRIQNNEFTDSDKYFVGLALLMPVLAGAFFGKEAALGALSGSAKGVADILGNRRKENMENEKLLADIQQLKGKNQLNKSEIELKKLGIPAEVSKNLPKDENEHLIGKQEAVWTDPATGKEMKGIRILPGLVVPHEYVKDKEELKEKRKEAAEISPAIQATREINKLTGEIIDVANRMKDKSIVGQALASILSGKDSGLDTKLGEQIEYQGRKVNSYVFLEHKLKLLVDAYRQAKGMRALTNTVQEHIDGLFRNPAGSFQSYKDTVDQMLYTDDLAQSRLLNTVEGMGFVPEFVIKELQPSVKNKYDKLNRSEGEKEAAELLR